MHSKQVDVPKCEIIYTNLSDEQEQCYVAQYKEEPLRRLFVLLSAAPCDPLAVWFVISILKGASVLFLVRCSQSRNG